MTIDINNIAKRIASDKTVPKSMYLKNPPSYIKKSLKDYEDAQWNGKIYRVGPAGSYYHVSPEGAELYRSIYPDNEVQEYDFPSFSKVALLDLDNEDHLNFIYETSGVESEMADDISTLIEGLLPILKNLGFDGLIINGETGSDVEGPPIEIIQL